jgi:thymidylate kinase
MRRFITFEGIEGCGKTTQIRLAEDWLRERGIPVLATAEPGGTPLGRKIREILLNRGSCTIGAEAELTFLFDLPVEVGLTRAEKRAAGGRPEAAEDRFEREDRTFHGRIREGYLSLAAEEPERFRIIDSAADVETVRREVCRHLTALL